jgi:hypothetical protein
MILYKGFWDTIQSPFPQSLAQLNTPLHFTPYLAVAEFYGQNGFVVVYSCDFPINTEPHPESSGPPFNFQVPDYQAILAPKDIERLCLIRIIKGQRLPGSVVIGPDGSTIDKSDLPAKIFDVKPEYHISHF